MQKVAAGCLALVLIAAVFLVITAVGTYNGLVTSSQAVDGLWAQVQNQYQRRADLVPNLVNTVAGAANFEKSTLAEITNARASVGQVKIDPNQAPLQAETMQNFQRAQDGLGSALSRLLVVSERYPDLKSNSNFRDLQAQLEGTENRIAVERGRFNEAVLAYNTKVRRFPTVVVAAMMGFVPKPFFQATAGAETPPKVDFDFGGSSAR